MTLVVVGVGLIGGSFAAAIRRSGLFGRILGLDQNQTHAADALAAGLIDAVCTEVPPDADAVLLAVPSDQIVEWVTKLAAHSAMVFDVGSVKGALLEQIRAELGSVPPNFVPCHPIAGKERSGPSAAAEDLFVDRQLIITPVKETDSKAITLVSQWWQAAGAVVEQMAPAAHDVTFATTSHLPHLIAFAYMQQVSEQDLRFAASGFRDFSRIAASDPDMWTAILQLNAPAIRQTLERLQEDLGAMDQALASGDTDAIRAAIELSQTRRQQFDE